MRDIQEFTELARGFAFMRKQKRSNRGDRATLKAYRGWLCLGNGYFGEAWEHVDHYGLVVKISGPTAWGRQDNQIETRAIRQGLKADAWPAFAAFCKANPHPRLPVVHHLEHISASFSFGVLDRLSTLDEAVSRRIVSRDAILDEMEVIESVLNGTQVSRGYEWLWPLIQLRSAMDFYVDLHEENVMWDDARVDWVITDPFSCTYGGPVAAYEYA